MKINFNITPYANCWHVQKYLATVLPKIVIIMKLDKNLYLSDEISDRENYLESAITSKLINSTWIKFTV